MPSHPGEIFLRGVTKRHAPPFRVDRMQHGHPGYRVIDGHGYVVRRYRRWRYAVAACQAMHVRLGADPPPEIALRRLLYESDWALVREREARAKEAAARRLIATA